MVERIKVFICYSRNDGIEAEELFRKLTEAGVDAWIDRHCLVLGDVWETEIRKIILSADAFVVCLSPDFEKIGFRQQEIRWALEAQNLRPPGQAFIIPYIIRPCRIPEWFRPFHAGTDIEQSTSLQSLFTALRKHFSRRFYPVRFLKAVDVERIEELADVLGNVGDNKAIDALLYRLGDDLVQQDPDLEDAVCGALVELGVMTRQGNQTFRFVSQLKLAPKILKLVERHRIYIPRKYFEGSAESGDDDRSV